MARRTISGGYSNLGARGKNFQKLMLSEKKKRSDLGLHIFLPKSKCSKKKKVFTSISSLISLFFSQNQGVLQKKKGLHFDFISDFPIFLPKSRRSLKKNKGLHSESSSEQTSAANPKLYMLFSRGGLRRLPRSPHPISTTADHHK